ncbi:MAG: hypothetical protein NTU61_02730 [Candidatus Altiarchaeota archaeon]|nr:hypothetical protein [Candidatus Altiarchaeota archaeon]
MADLDYIKGVEEEVKSRVEAARIESSHRIEAARLARSEVIRLECLKSEKKTILLVDAAVKDAGKKAAAVLSDSESRIRRIKSTPEGRIDEAVDYVLKEMGV